jgi:PTS system nitrogen regulatory IIA component
MKLRDLVDVHRVHLGLEARDLSGALEAAADTICDDAGVERHQIVQALLDRERLGSTSVGSGFAIPHCKLDSLDQLVVSMVRFSDPVDFGAADDEPVQFFFVVLSPPDQPAAHLRVLSQIARVLKRSELRESLLSAADAESIVEAIRGGLDAEAL